MENIARSADGVGRACAWAGGSGQGQNKYGELEAHKEKVSGIICSTGMMEKAPRVPVLTLHLVVIFIFWAYYSVAGKFQPIYPVSGTLCWVRQTLHLTICRHAGVDSHK